MTFQPKYREATSQAITAIAALLSNPQNENYWQLRVEGYFNKTHHPQKALSPRILYVATISEKVIGIIAGHLTQRFECDGELQWINVTENNRGSGIAGELLLLLAKWFVDQNAYHICVDVGSETGRKFYAKHGAEYLNEHWMVWKNINNILEVRP